jgi:hypothetical protein
MVRRQVDSLRTDALMQSIAPDILTEARGLSPALSGVVLAIGCLLWLCGWRWHRFWVVVSITAAGGLIGLNSGRASGGHMLALGVLLAVSAGVLALEVARVLAFAAGGLALWSAASALFPSARELWVAFLVGGLAGVVLYRLWTMLLTSLAGALLVGHAGLCLAERLAKLDAAAWATAHAHLLNGVVIGATLAGLAAQSLLERMDTARAKRRQEDAADEIRQEERSKLKAASPSKPGGFWERLTGKKAA